MVTFVTPKRAWCVNTLTATRCGAFKRAQIFALLIQNEMCNFICWCCRDITHLFSIFKDSGSLHPRLCQTRDPYYKRTNINVTTLDMHIRSLHKVINSVREMSYKYKETQFPSLKPLNMEETACTGRRKFNGSEFKLYWLLHQMLVRLHHNMYSVEHYSVYFTWKLYTLCFFVYYIYLYVPVSREAKEKSIVAREGMLSENI